MGRYFKAQEVELNRDFIYQPPIELMAKVIQGKDLAVDKYNEYQASIDEKLKAEGLKADEPRLREIINNYHSQIDERAKIIQSNPLEAAKEMGALKALGRDISDNWSQGEVAKIQGNKKLRDKYVEDLNKRKDVSEEWKTKALEKFDKEFTGTNFDNSGKYNDYKYENLNDKFDINEFLNKNLNGFEANGKKYSKDTVSGQWIKSDGDSTEEVTFDELYKTGKQLLDSNQEAKDYYNQSQRLGFLTPEQVGYEVENALTGYADKYSYKKEEEDHSIKENSNYWKQLEWNKAAEAEKAAALAEVNKDASEIYNNSVATRHFEQDYLNELKKGLTFGSKVKLNSIDDLINVLNNPATKKTPFILKKLAEAQQIQVMVKNSMKASYAGYYNIPNMNEEGVEKIRKGQNEHLLANGQSYNFRMPPMEVINKDGSRQTYNLKNGYQEFTPKNMVGKNIRTPDGRLVQVKNVSPVENSIIPILLNGINNNKSINDNDAHATLKFTVYDPTTKNEESFTRTAYYNMSEAEGLSLK